MKNRILTIILILTTQITFSQIEFQENIVIDNTFGVRGPVSIYSADIDGDGDLDLLSASTVDNTLAWYENMDGMGNYSKPNVISNFADEANSVFAADVDGDGDMDVISGSKGDNTVAWYENVNGDGTSWNYYDVSRAAINVTSVHAADMDSDGDIDLISSSSGKVVWYENINGVVTFVESSISSKSVNQVIASDVDNDGDMDILTASSQDSSISWYENINGTGTFSSENIISSNADGARSVFALDIDGDGDMDVVSASFRDDKIAWYKNNNGQGNFSSQRIISSNADGASWVHGADLDGDGDMDILSTSREDNKVAWYENTTGQGNFSTEQVITDNFASALSVIASDLDGDNDIDVVAVSSEGGKVEWFKNINGQGNFNSQQNITTNVLGANKIVSTDIDGDGDLDILTCSFLDNEISWFENMDGSGTYGIQKIIAITPFLANDTFASDIDGDGDMDVLSASDNSKRWYENLDGQGTFSEARIIERFSGGAIAISTADFDGDGDMDVLAAESTSFAGDNVFWHENLDGQGSYGPQNSITTQISNVRSVVAADIDGDGDLDVVSASASDRTIAWYENMDGLGNFGTQVIISNTINVANSIFVADIDNDNDLDIVSGSGDNRNQVTWFENTNGSGSFVQQNIIANNRQGTRSLFAGDIDGDGDLDIVYGSDSISQSAIAWHENMDGLGNFGAQQVISTDANLPLSISIADLNGNGRMDVLSASSRDGKIAWYKNQTTPLNQIIGTVVFDVNANGCAAGDVMATGIKIVASDGTNSYSTFMFGNGSYQIPVPEGNFTTQIENLLSYYTSSSSSQSSSFTGLGNTDTVDFCLTTVGTANDLSISVFPTIDDPRPGFDATYQIIYKNSGTTQLSGDVIFEYDTAKMQFLNASEILAAQSAGTLSFDFTALNPFETRTVYLKFNVFPPPTTNIDDILTSTATISPIAGDDNEDDNVFILDQTVIGSYDPNDIAVLEGEEILLEDAGEFLHYIIRFQNTGTASAINVNIENLLDTKLNFATMQIQSLSHPGRVEIKNGNEVKFIFDDINLPDSTSDEPNSHGFITYKIKPKSDVVIGDIFNNNADIFFDFNPAIVTNTVSTEIVRTLSVSDTGLNTISIFPNPANSNLTIDSRIELKSISVLDINGRRLNNVQPSTSQYRLNINYLSNGIYFLEIQTEGSKKIMKFIKN